MSAAAHPNDSPLAPELAGRVLARLGFAAAPQPDFAGLSAVYASWCERVPFDNLRKLIHLAASDPAPLAGDSVTGFFEAWLAWGTGGTCWAGNGALAMLLRTLGFDAVRGVATMLVAPDLPPNHGTVVVTLGERRWLVDASMLFGEPLLLDESRETRIEHPGWGVRCAMRDGRFHVSWKPLHVDSLDCRIESLSSSAEEFCRYHEATRGWSPFNYSVHARIVRGDRTIGVAFGQRVTIATDGTTTRDRIAHEDRQRILVHDLGIHPELAARVPADRELPPPPGSLAAAARPGALSSARP